VISAGMASLRELQTFYGTFDLYQMIEVLLIDRHNEWLAQRRGKER
jgi:hypothetical protein